MYEQKIIENLREFSAKYQYEDQRLSETCFRAAGSIEELQKPKWISAKERLPEDVKPCVVLLPMYDSYLDKEYLQLYEGILGYDGDGWNDEDGIEFEFEVAYWFPIPEPPKEER